MLRCTRLVCGRGAVGRLSSSFCSESALPPNLLLPTNLVDPSRSKRPPSCRLLPPAAEELRRRRPRAPERRPGVGGDSGGGGSEPLGWAQLHPDVFAVAPRLDILHEVETWQKNFKRISHANTKIRSEVRGGGRKPWNQKGSGRARHGSIRSPIWKGGGVSNGPRGPTSYFYMLPMKLRVQGLKVALSSKLAQDDLHIVDSVNLSSPDPQDLLHLVREKLWGESVLIVDVGEEFPENILEATASLKTVNIIPAIGLNVHSMLKHEALVLTLQSVRFLEEKLLWHDQRYTPLYPYRLPYSDLP